MGLLTRLKKTGLACSYDPAFDDKKENCCNMISQKYYKVTGNAPAANQEDEEDCSKKTTIQLCPRHRMFMMAC